MKHIFVTLAFILLAGCARQRHPEEASAIYAAQTWLQELDGGAYAASWSNAAAYFQGMVTENEWTNMMTSGRSPLGEVISRDFKAARHFTSLPGVPDGDYIVIQFATSFARKKNAVETVTPMKEENGDWRVSGYFVK